MGLFNFGKRTKQKSFDLTNLFYSKIELVRDTPIKVPAGEVWKVVGFFLDDNKPSGEVMAKLLTYYDSFCQETNLPDSPQVPEFTMLITPPMTFIDNDIPYYLNQRDTLDSLSKTGWFVVLRYEILNAGTDKEQEYWKRLG